MTLLYLSLAALTGIILGQALLERGFFGCGAPAWAWTLAAALVLLTPLLRRFERAPQAALVWPTSAGFRAPRRGPGLALSAACALALAAGLLRSAARPLYPCWTQADLAYYNLPSSRAFDWNALWVTVHGNVGAYVPQAAGSVRLYVAAESITLPSGARPVTGQLTLRSDKAAGLQYGDRVEVRGVLSQPPEFPDFSWRDSLARHGIYSQMAIAQLRPVPGEPGGSPLLRALYAVRARGETLINASLPEPYAALANGILLGIDANIPDPLLADFNETSATHVLVISGSNVALITGVLLAVGMWLFGRKGAALWAVGGVTLYALLVGAEPSVLRAAWMGALVVIAFALRRQSTALVALGVASLALVLLNPHTLWDVGFQLSAAATAGLILIAPPAMRATHHLFERRAEDRSSSGDAAATGWQGPARAAADALAVTLAATIAVTPLLIHYFHRLSLIGLLTNLLIAPVQPLILFAGMAALVAGLLGIAALSTALFWLSWVGLAWTVQVVERTAAMPWASAVIGGYGAAEMAVTYAAIALVLWQARRRPVYVRRKAPSTPGWQRALSAPATMVIAAAAGFFVWNGVAALPDGRLHLYAMPSASGIALFIETPGGRQALIDGSSDAARLIVDLGERMRPWDRDLDLAILTRDHKRTAAAQASAAGRLRFDHALTSEATLTERFDWETAMHSAGAEVAATARGGWVDLGDGVALWVLSPAPGAKGPLALWLDYGEFGALILGETPKKTLAELAWNLPRKPTLLFLPAAGARGEERNAFVNAVDAEGVIVYGDGVLRESTAQQPYYVDAQGTIDVATDGTAWEVGGGR